VRITWISNISCKTTGKHDACLNTLIIYIYTYIYTHTHKETYLYLDYFGNLEGRSVIGCCTRLLPI
jgi:hypothetical protein